MRRSRKSSTPKYTGNLTSLQDMLKRANGRPVSPVRETDPDVLTAADALLKIGQTPPKDEPARILPQPTFPTFPFAYGNPATNPFVALSGAFPPASFLMAQQFLTHLSRFRAAQAQDATSFENLDASSMSTSPEPRSFSPSGSSNGESSDDSAVRRPQSNSGPSGTDGSDLDELQRAQRELVRSMKKEFVRADNGEYVLNRKGARVVRCCTCQGILLDPSSWNRHARNHAGIKNHLCPCGSMFNQRYNMKTHMLTEYANDLLMKEDIEGCDDDVQAYIGSRIDKARQKVAERKMRKAARYLARMAEKQRRAAIKKAAKNQKRKQ